MKTIFVLFVAAFISFNMTSIAAEDFRDISHGFVIPDQNYCDQPYVVVAKDGNWLCTLTTGKGKEGSKDQHIVSAISTDKGRTWSHLVNIEPSNGIEASWVTPLVVPSGRVYVFYTYNGDKIQTLPDGKPIRADTLGWYCFKYSDDNGRSWSAERHRLPLKLTPCDRTNNWNGRVQMFWGIDKPKFVGKEAVFAFTKLQRHMFENGEGWLFKSDNILSEKDPTKLHWTMLPDGDHGIRSPEFGSIQEEHNIVPMSDGKLYMVYRTTKGFPCHCYSSDGGHTWSKPVAMRYAPGGRTLKNNKSCPKLWKTANGRYLFWYHNFSHWNSPGRNPAWICGGVEKDGKICWSQPEIILYDKDPKIFGISYPDLIEQDGRYWITETNKTVARVHEIDKTIFEDLWNQATNNKAAKRNLLLEWRSSQPADNAALPKTVDIPKTGGLTLDCWVRLENVYSGQSLVDCRGTDGKQISLSTIEGGAVRFTLSDGKNTATLDSDPNLLKPGKPHHIVAIADAGPKIVTFVIDGLLCDGGKEKQQGWKRWKGTLGAVADVGKITPGSSLESLRIYDRYLRTSEAVGNYHHGLETLENTSGVSTSDARPKARSIKDADPRYIRNYPLLPDENYCDQPYVVITKDGNWLCTMTTGPGSESQEYQHIVATISTDHGKTWCKPIDIEPGRSPDWRMASWAVPLITPSGRVYVFYDYDGDKIRKRPNGKRAKPSLLGWYCYKYSDDNGRTWSKKRYRLPLRLTEVDRNNDWKGKVQMFWGIDKPIVVDQGRSVLLSFTKLGRYQENDGEGWFFSSDNILTEPDPEKIRWKLLPEGEYGVRNPAFGSIQEEHNIEEMNNGNIICVYRTTMGFPGLSFSKEGGRNWSLPEAMRYRPGGRAIKHNRACPMLWKTSAGKYLFWFNNNGNRDYPNRNPVWIIGGVEKDGAIYWSQPEVLFYDNHDVKCISYPNMFEQDGRYWIAETNKFEARVHEIDKTLLEGMWLQGSDKTIARNGLIVEWRDGDDSAALKIPLAVNFTESNGLTLDCWIELRDLSPGQTIVDHRNSDGKGFSLETIENGAVQLRLSDGKETVEWHSDEGLLQPGKRHHLVAIADAGPQIITFVVDGTLCDGREKNIQGWYRWRPGLKTIAEVGPIRIGSALKSLRVYDRYLRTLEAVANFNAK